MAVLVHAREHELTQLDALQAAIAPFAVLERVDEGGILKLCPAIRTGAQGSVAGLVDRHGIRLDPHALLQAHVRALRRNGGEIVTSARVARLERSCSNWTVLTEADQHFSAPTVINAAGAWADAVALLAGVGPMGLSPLRRTIITFDGPPGVDVSGWPFAKTVGENLYFAPESGRLFASPMDEGATDPRAEGFFWLAGQGGFGLQTSPIMARIVESLIANRPWPIGTVSQEDLSPARFLG
jgi:D-arginine dehydrogenase